ncbi:MAG TPA: hypothetical protein VGC29_04805 [Flavisolibacter sp.]
MNNENMADYIKKKLKDLEKQKDMELISREDGKDGKETGREYFRSRVHTCSELPATFPPFPPSRLKMTAK